MELAGILLAVLGDTLRDVAPIAAVIFGFQFFVIRKPIPHLRRFIIGFSCVILGLAFFLVGLDLALFPLGRSMAIQLTQVEFVYGADAAAEAINHHWTNYYWVYVFALAIGFSAVLVEPAVIAVALKANEVSGGVIHANGLRIAIAIGVGVGIMLGSYRIISGGELHHFIIAAYAVVIVQTYFAPQQMIPIAYDSGGVSTSTVTVPLVAALGLGLASSIPGRSPMLDGFGLIAFAVLFPIISVLAYAQLARARELLAARRRTRDT
ncbi:MAG: DUF1538 domain-containing protein [Gammaproteobacteria bacterium]